MNLDFEKDAELKLNRFKKLGTWYILALSMVASVALVGQLLIQNHLNDQLSDSRVVNVAGKQRMLSQKLTKTILLLAPNQARERRISILSELGPTLNLWRISQEGLLHGNDSLALRGKNSQDISTGFERISNAFDEMQNSASGILSLLNKNPTVTYDSLTPYIDTILNYESEFLAGMDSVVFMYDAEAQNKVAKLSQLEYLLLGIALLVITLEILFIFRPTTGQVNRTVNKLVSSEKNAKKLSKEIGALYASLEKSYEQLSHLNQPVENPRIYARADKGGTIIFISDLYKELSRNSNFSDSIQITDLFPGNDQNGDRMDEIVEAVSEGQTWQGQFHWYGMDKQERWTEVVVIPIYNESDEVDELLVTGSDITLRKLAEKNMGVKNRAEIEKKINEQKFRSVLILEGQEEERKRIAMDIHDGIGQVLTSLKFQFESIDLSGGADKIKKKLIEIQQLIDVLIKEVRKVTFDLKPTVLGDYGLPAALNVLIKEIGKLTDIEMTYHSDGNFSFRLPQKIENNIFRIVQEATNNAIKYSGAGKIEVSLTKAEDLVTITIEDNGKGFDEKLIEARSVNIESGRGFFNMYERTEYINGHLEIKSTPGRGTKVMLTLPVKSPVPVEQ